MPTQNEVRCPACGREGPAGPMFCPWDGKPLERIIPFGSNADELLQTQVGEYRIEERIGSGGMGNVYRAVQPLIGKQVAIKVLRAEFASSRELVQRLLVEARAVNSIRHRGIIDIFGFGALPDGRPYVVMELLQGQPLDKFIRAQGRLTTAATIEILDEILAALGAAHRVGIVHRDLKPANVFLVVDPDGERRLKLLDFGIAKITAAQADSPKTIDGTLMGTPEYMAPEQVRSGPVDARTDLYAVGIIAFRLLTGALPFRGDAAQVLFAQAHTEPPPPSSLVPDVPPALDTLVRQLLSKEPEERPRSAEEVRLALRQRPETSDSAPTMVLPEFTQPDSNASAPPPWKWLGTGVAALGVLTMLGMGGVLLLRHAESQEGKAKKAAEAVAAPATASGAPPPEGKTLALGPRQGSTVGTVHVDSPAPSGTQAGEALGVVADATGSRLETQEPLDPRVMEEEIPAAARPNSPAKVVGFPASGGSTQRSVRHKRSEAEPVAARSGPRSSSVQETRVSVPGPVVAAGGVLSDRQESQPAEPPSNAPLAKQEAIPPPAAVQPAALLGEQTLSRHRESLLARITQLEARLRDMEGTRAKASEGRMALWSLRGMGEMATTPQEVTRVSEVLNGWETRYLRK